MPHAPASGTASSRDIVGSEGLVKALTRIATVQGANIVTRAEISCAEPPRDGICGVHEAEEITERRTP
jgi:hypothetical protein